MSVRESGLAFVVSALFIIVGPFATRAPADDPTPPPPKAPSDPGNLLGAWTKKLPVPAPTWRDKAIVDMRFAEALDAVEKSCGARFAKRPTVRISTRTEVRRIVEAEFAGLPKSLGLQDLSRAMLDVIVGALAAKYDVASHVVHVVPENVEQTSGFVGENLGTEDQLRVVLAHECTHALDFPRFAWEESRRKISAEMEFQAFSAVVEGHAQFVAKRVAERWKISNAFDAFTKAMGAIPEDAPEFLIPLLRSTVSEVTFGYWQGHAFLEAVAAEAGEKGVLRALAGPPKTTREIEHPNEWLHPEQASTGLDLTPVLSALEFLVPSPWNIERADVLEDTVKGQFADLPPNDVKGVFVGYQSARVLVANRLTSASEGFVVLAVQFSDASGARAFAALDRRASEMKDTKMNSGLVRVKSADYADGAGTGGKWPGSTTRKVITAGPITIPSTSAIVAAGEIAFEVAVFGLEVERAWMDGVVDALAEYVTDPAHPVPHFSAGAALKVPDGPSGPDIGRPKRIPMQIVGFDGQVVKRARLAVRYVSASRNLSIECRFEDGEAQLPDEATTASFLIFGVVGSGGEVLDSGPLVANDVDLGAKDLRFKLPLGHAVVGRVLDASGKGVEGAQAIGSFIETSPRGTRYPENTKIASSKTDAVGRYELKGLGSRTAITFETPAPYATPPSIVFEGTGTAPDVVLAEGLSVVVTVVDPAGDPLAGAMVDWARVIRTGRNSTRSEWSTGAIRTDSKGHATLVGIPRDTDLALSVTPPDGDASLGRYDAPTWDGRELEVKLERTQRVRGRVVDLTGMPAPRARVHLRSHGQNDQSAPAEADGKFVFEGVPIGPVAVGATVGADMETGHPVRWFPVVPGTLAEVVVGTGPLTITIRGLPAGRVVHTRRPGTDRPVGERKSDPGGVVRFPGETIGSRTDVFVAPTEDDPRGISALDVELADAGVTLDLVRCVRTRGRVRASMTYEHLDVSIVAPWDELAVKVDPSGTFELPLLPPGKYPLLAEARGAEAPLHGRTDFEPGKEGLVLELKPKDNLLAAHMKVDEIAAFQTLQNIIVAQAQFQALAKADTDNDGTGEYGGLLEMSDAALGRMHSPLSPAVLGVGYRKLNSEGQFSRSGYLFRVFCPGRMGIGVGEPATGFTASLLNADLAETSWCCYAWPVGYGVTGRRTFFTNERGEITVTEASGYSGASAGPKADAAFTSADAGRITGTPAVGVIGVDGNVWKQPD